MSYGTDCQRHWRDGKHYLGSLESLRHEYDRAKRFDARAYAISMTSLGVARARREYCDERGRAKLTASELRTMARLFDRLASDLDDALRRTGEPD